VAIVQRMMLLDTAKCIGCKACQVACKQWHELPADTTSFTGSYQNPTGFSDNTWTYVKFKEYSDLTGKLNFLLFKNQCRHCVRPKCQPRNPKGVKRFTNGFVLYNDNCTWENVRLSSAEKIWRDNLVGDPAKKAYTIELFTDACPFRVPRYNDYLDKFVKCDFCFNRFGGEYSVAYRGANPTTACEMTCPPGAIQTGSVAEITALATARYKKVRKDYPEASLYTGGFGRTNVVFLLTQSASSYGFEPNTRGL